MASPAGRRTAALARVLIRGAGTAMPGVPRVVVEGTGGAVVAQVRDRAYVLHAAEPGSASEAELRRLAGGGAGCDPLVG